ncbi:TPA: hypothetical protein ACVO0S_001534 [Vibrio alginolyticus]
MRLFVIVFVTLLTISTEAYSNHLSTVCTDSHIFFRGWQVDYIASLSSQGYVLVGFHQDRNRDYRFYVHDNNAPYYFSVIQTAHDLYQRVNVCISGDYIFGIEVDNKS